MSAKKYSGRLAFDPDSGFHIGEDGEKVVTADGGQTWHVAAKDDPSHIERYQERAVTIDTTANAGVDGNNYEPHHYEVQPDDPHFNGVRADPDVEAATVTAHTDAYKEV